MPGAYLKNGEGDDGGRHRRDRDRARQPAAEAPAAPGAVGGNQADAGRRELPDPVRGVKHLLAHPLRRRDRGGQTDPGRGFPQPPDLFGAGRALLQVLLEFVELITGQRVDGVDAGQQVEVVALNAHWDTSMQSRIRMRPSRIRVLTVPSGSPSSPATSG